MSKSKAPLYIKNFGVGKYISPYKTTGDDEENTTKEEFKEKEQGGDAQTADKGWVKALKAATTMASHGLASVYGGTAHTPKINWGKRQEKTNEEVNTDDNASEMVDNILGEDAPDDNANPEPMSFGSQAEGDEFRGWIHKHYPEYAKRIDLDPTGSHTNSYIQRAFKKYGSEFRKANAQGDQGPFKFVSPLKARKRGVRGKSATRGKSTSTRRRRGGFTRGGKGGKNIGHYNVQTRFSPRETMTTPSGGGGVTSPSGGTGQPYSFDKMGNMVFSPVINNIVGGDQGKPWAEAGSESNSGMEWVPPEYGTRKTKGNLPTYREAWDNNNRNVQDKYDTFEDFETAAIDWNKKHGTPSSGGGTERYLIREGYYRPTGGTSSSYARSGVTMKEKPTYQGKFNVGGYRTMHGQ